ncbi:unnamed protein product [Rotaria sp. Silwood1]|nr:unnamed protein product [Rotaria sp. Silwood1]
MFNFNDNTSDYLYLSSNARAEFATDNTSHYLQQITNQEINKLIVYQVNHHETIISIIHSFIYMSLYLFIYLCRNILSFLLIIYEIITNKNRYNVSMHQSELEFVNLSNGLYVQSNRDAQAEGRTAYSSDQTIILSPTVIITNDEQLSIEDRQAHDAGVLRGINNNRPTYVITYNQNTHVNQDLTLYTTTNDNIFARNVQTGENIQFLNNNDISEPVVDDPTYNVNLLNSVEPQDDIESNDRSDDEQDLIISSESGFDGGDKYDSIDDNESRDRILQTAENLNNNVQNNHQLDQTIFDNEQRTRTDTLLSHHEPIEMQENVSVLIEDARATIEDATCLISIFNQKQTNPTDLNIESDEIRID